MTVIQLIDDDLLWFRALEKQIMLLSL